MSRSRKKKPITGVTKADSEKEWKTVREKLTQERLKQLLFYDEKVGVFSWREKRNNRVAIGQVAGTPDSGGYLMIGIDGKRYKVHRLAWLYVYGKFPEKELDHINHNRADNRIKNLREANRSENMQNARKPKTNTSGVKGVSWEKERKKWRADIMISGSHIFLGLFDSIEEAKTARHDAKKKYHLFSQVD